MNQTTSNVVQMNPDTPTFTKVGHEWSNFDKVAWGKFRPVSMHVSREQERMQLNSLADWLGFEIPESILKGYSDTFGYRYLNSNNKDWRSFGGTETSPIQFEMWWEDCIYVLSQIVPDIALEWLEPVSNLPDELQSFFGKRCRNRLKYPNKKKIAWFRSQPPLDNEDTIAKANSITHQLQTYGVWSKIKENIPLKVVNNNYFPFTELPELLSIHLLTEMSLPTLGVALFGEEKFKEGEHSFVTDDDDDSIGERYRKIGDGALLYAFLHHEIARKRRTLTQIEEMLDDGRYTKFFGEHEHSEKLKNLILTLLTHPEHVPTYRG